MKQGMDRGRGNAKKRVADMSLPAEQRRRRRKGKGEAPRGLLRRWITATIPRRPKAAGRLRGMSGS